METTYYNPKTQQVNKKTIEKPWAIPSITKRKSTQSIITNPATKVCPDFGSERMSDFCQMLYGG
jgi:hypothetical protein